MAGPIGGPEWSPLNLRILDAVSQPEPPILDLHDGQIRPERREPHGCRMVVVLPGGKP
jgi:hypothetical protein